MSTTCKYCNEAEDKQTNPGLICQNCMCFVHLSCLKSRSTPGDFSCDVFFDFTCEECSPNNKEIFSRNKFPWANVILLTLYHLNSNSYGISNQGFFHYKTHICTFIDRNWQLLFDPQCKQKKNWVGTIVGALSVYNHLFFLSGSGVLMEPGWWRLLHNFSPAVGRHIMQEMVRGRTKSRSRSQVTPDKSHFISKVTELGYRGLLNEEISPRKVVKIPPLKKRKLNPDSEFSTVLEEKDLERKEIAHEPVLEGLQNNKTEDSCSDAVPNSDTSSIHSMQRSTICYDSDSRSRSPNYQQEPFDLEGKRNVELKITETKKRSVKPPIVKRENLFSTQLNSVDLPWLENSTHLDMGQPALESKDLVEITHYEEIQLLKKVENMIPKIKDPNKKADLSRFKAKLVLRRLKRYKHLPIFNLDNAVKLYGGYVTEDTRTEMNTERVLDRFQRSYLIDNLCGTIASTNYGTLLLSHMDPSPFRSTYSGITLKPYIRRDADTKPLWLRLTNELLRKTNKHNVYYSPPPDATIDYSYVRPQHIAAVNNLCTQFFWPGIDLTEALQYPEFSCVVTYKKLVVGCAFLVPDVRPNEAYISFILTRPEWRNAGIASFMLYHLLQTCSGKDVTLHVSPTNPAIFLYQKFGFKVEELIQDFYEKYFDMFSKGCTHALFLRLVR